MAKTAVVILLLRTITGILFFFQGYDKLFNIKVPNVVKAFNESYARLIPGPLLFLAVYCSSLIELLAGICLFLGVFKIYALYALCVNLFFVAFSFSLIKPMWDMQFYFPRLILISALLLLSGMNDPFSLQAFLKLN